MPGQRVQFGIIGSKFQAECHALALKEGQYGDVAAFASPSTGHAAQIAARFDADHYTDYREMLRREDIDVVTVAAPNRLHCQMTVDAADAGKHVVVEKPMAMTLAECDRMIEACRRNGVLLMYAEELFFTPKYLRAKEMADQGAFGTVFLVKQSEMHSGPHGDWFWDVSSSGGGVLMDMGCHGLSFCHWFLGRPEPVAITAHLGTYVHGDRTRGEDHTFAIVEFEGGAIGHVENSWARQGGMDDRVEVYGSEGLTLANLHMGNALPTFSAGGYGYAVEKAPTTRGWTYPVFEELWNYGFPQEMDHFARCARDMEEPRATGEDGRVALQMVLGGYESAGAGRRVTFPSQAPEVQRPIDLWLDPPAR